MKILLDMNLTPGWARYLQSSGFEAVHWSQIGRPDAPDEEIMMYAAKQEFVVLTHELDFSAILAATKGKQAERHSDPSEEHYSGSCGPHGHFCAPAYCG
jgi:predicted nuclease of predicted toxin-antitoxin system